MHFCTHCTTLTLTSHTTSLHTTNYVCCSLFVHTAYGNAANAWTFSYFNRLVLTSVTTPTSSVSAAAAVGSAAGGTPVVLKGVGFSPTLVRNVVTFGSSSASMAVVVQANYTHLVVLVSDLHSTPSFTNIHINHLQKHSYILLCTTQLINTHHHHPFSTHPTYASFPGHLPGPVRLQSPPSSTTVSTTLTVDVRVSVLDAMLRNVVDKYTLPLAFQYSAALTPVLSYVSPSLVLSGSTLLIEGSKLGASGTVGNAVTVGLVPCAVNPPSLITPSLITPSHNAPFHTTPLLHPKPSLTLIICL